MLLCSQFAHSCVCARALVGAHATKLLVKPPLPTTNVQRTNGGMLLLLLLVVVVVVVVAVPLQNAYCLVCPSDGRAQIKIRFLQKLDETRR